MSDCGEVLDVRTLFSEQRHALAATCMSLQAGRRSLDLDGPGRAAGCGALAGAVFRSPQGAEHAAEQ